MEDARLREGAPEGEADAPETAINVLGAATDALEAALAFQGGARAVAPGLTRGRLKTTQIASAVFARRPGDGSAREQAASCQRVLGGGANICYEYATKRYRSNLINWGMLPFTIDGGCDFSAEPGDWIYIPGVRGIIAGSAANGDSGQGEGASDADMEFDALLIKDKGAVAGGGDVCQGFTAENLKLRVGGLTDEEREIILCGCLMNYYAAKNN